MDVDRILVDLKVPDGVIAGILGKKEGVGTDPAYTLELGFAAYS